MFETETLFILGAGASVPYGYPLGEKLVENIIKDMGDTILLPRHDKITTKWIDGLSCYSFSDYHEDFQSMEELPSGDLHKDMGSFYNTGKWEEGCYACAGRSFKEIKIEEFAEFYNLKKALQTFNPISIDTFLRDNPSHALAGKIMIVYSRIHCIDILAREAHKLEQKITDDWSKIL